MVNKIMSLRHLVTDDGTLRFSKLTSGSVFIDGFLLLLTVLQQTSSLILLDKHNLGGLRILKSLRLLSVKIYAWILCNKK